MNPQLAVLFGALISAAGGVMVVMVTQAYRRREAQETKREDLPSRFAAQLMEMFEQQREALREAEETNDRLRQRNEELDEALRQSTLRQRDLEKKLWEAEDRETRLTDRLEKLVGQVEVLTAEVEGLRARVKEA